ncbi:low-specificity L-threonine aldolase [Undibacterium fentianense]|uniref:Low-specificity L-threonine aldolase n=1 Tax=Undibacterium fentianense TaxID=2828728 RepID=A0A941E2A0_9BURK|nr:low-specificity L-threonine aldolase [Undibacterium fentianense]MBR7800091.1 low-specificity L-threonine aldolase [Undibacterium fentianense]
MIDFRSDTVTRPSLAMRAVIAQAEVGDDVYGDDPTVNALEEKMASLLGMESAMLVASGTQSNLIALLTHCGRGDEYIVGQQYHTYLYESGGAASLGSIVPQPIPVESDGSLELQKIAAVVKPNDIHYAKSTLLSLENTHHGKVLSNEYLHRAVELAHSYKMAAHLDGARIFNAAVAQEVPVRAITEVFDTVSVCCSKGLGAPIGSVLCGSQEFIQKARRWRKMVGGGMRQAGLIAAGIDYALDHHVARLADDHAHALLLQESLQQIPELEVETAHTNMLYVEFASHEVGLQAGHYLRERGIRISAGKRVRLVTHLDISREDIVQCVAAFKSFFHNLH